MDTPSLTAGTGPLPRTGHPVQSAGAWALAVMARHQTPEEVTVAELDTLCRRIVADACAAGAATPESPAYDWWKVLAALYPNSKIAHNGRPRDPAVLREQLLPFFAPDDPAGGAAWPCTYCHTPAAHVWGKTMLPVVDSTRYVNNLPNRRIAGWPVCRACRISAWAFPYGAWAAPGSVTALTAERHEIERTFAAANVRRATRIMRDGFGGRVPRGGAHLRAMRSAAGVTGLSAINLYEMRNDNQDPWITIHRARRSVPAFAATVRGNTPLRRAWRLLELGIGDDGPEEAAYWLFEREGEQWTLLGLIHQLLRDVDRWSLTHRDLLTRLAFTFAETVY